MGAEAVNVKCGCVADVAGNVMFSPNTNGLKLSSSGQSETRKQAKIQAYNNTIINAGWRRDGEKGGCVYAEKNVLANVFNNLMVNCSSVLKLLLTICPTIRKRVMPQPLSSITITMLQAIKKVISYSTAKKRVA